MRSLLGEARLGRLGPVERLVERGPQHRELDLLLGEFCVRWVITTLASTSTRSSPA
ncbi:hypothetical protein ACFP82_12280 [Cellulomonas gelida]|uniref:hypothetical protein n=1 Tax=Cellulomonas gelida TaxID=1712 RepID=UPI0036071F11